jgi:hypothetical protein
METWNNVLPKEYNKCSCVRSRLIAQLRVPTSRPATMYVQDASRVRSHSSNRSALLNLMRVRGVVLVEYIALYLIVLEGDS